MSGMRVFVSYSSKQREWVWDRLVPCLKAGGAVVLIDRERFKAGISVAGQMDATQDEADRHILVLSPDYLASMPCLQEMNRAIALDPEFENGIVLPLLRIDCELPNLITKPNPLHIDLCDDNNDMQWKKLLDGCGADLGVGASVWLKARDETRRFIRRNESVNLVVSGNGKVKWRELIANLSSEDDSAGTLPALPVVDLQSGATVSRRSLVSEIIRVLGGHEIVPNEPEDLLELDRFICRRTKSYMALVHFDFVLKRPQYDANLFGALRYLVVDQQKLVLLIQSRAPLPTLLPPDNPMSSPFTSLKMVELKAYV